MAVSFPAPNGYTLNPAHTSEMIQGFVNIENAEGSANGRITKAQMQDYQLKHANTIDANTAVANYLSTNFDSLSQRVTKDGTIGLDDLVELQRKLPAMPTVNNPPLPEDWAYTNGNTSTNTNGTNFIPVYIPYPVPSNGTGVNIGQPGQPSPFNTGYGSYNPATTGQNVSQVMFSLLQQMMQMMQAFIQQ